MTEKLPRIVKKQAISENLYPGTYYFCTCGLSSEQPFCNGAHKGTEFEPKRFKIEEPTNAYLCLCKHTKKAPYCDGSHRSLDQESA